MAEVYPPGPLGQTRIQNWRLDSSDSGRHNWFYVRNEKEGEERGAYEEVWREDKRRVRDRKEEEMTDEEKYWLGLDLGADSLPDPNGNPLEAARNCYTFYKRLQSADGHWSGLYDGPGRSPGIVFAMYITKTPIPEEWRIEISRYLFNTQRKGEKDNRGWGIHIESQSTVFGTALNYVAMRILGVDAEEECMVQARGTLHALGGATGVPSWGKFWLSLMNLYEWDGVSPVPPELWLLPNLLPIHPWRWWIHTRNVYIPVGYLCGLQYKTPLTPLLEKIREEIYVQSYSEIHWPSCRTYVAPIDLYSPHTKTVDALFSLLGLWDKWICPSIVRKKGLEAAYKLIVYEDENTAYQTIGPVSKAFNMVSRFVAEGEHSEAVRLHREKVRDFMWMSPKGLVMTGTNGSQLWDTAFITQALVDTGLATDPSNKKSILKAHQWLDDCQIKDNPKHYHSAYRQASKGAWPFSTREQSYTVSDTTAEGLKSVLFLQEKLRYGFVPKSISKQRLCDTVDVLLSLQNADGGFSSYEPIRGPLFCEWLNCAEVFGNIMVEYSYPECTNSVVTGLVHFRRTYPDYRKDDIDVSMKRAISYIHSKQRSDGSWYGSWAICFTYAMMFALESLALVGETYDTSDRVRKACQFLLSKQKPDGGWGESYLSCELQEYTQHQDSQVVQTSWAILSLLHAKCPNHDAIRSACNLIMSRQRPDGSFKQEAIEGVFNKNCAIAYPNYKFSWTIWALGRAHKELAKEKW
ncbi:terpene synthase [Atractiella rhizophila]|nr:terpene synthase [Atractiella rhizophila]